MEAKSLTAAEVAEILVKESIARYGSAAPVMPMLESLIAKKAKPVDKRPADWKKKLHTCPQCGKTGPIETLFGTRFHRGIERKQSWCYECRASKRDKPRR